MVRGPEKKTRRAKIVGVGLDGDGEAVRVTRGKNFHLLGGSKDTHESMQEKCIKLNEKLASRGKQLDDLEANELLELAGECDMPLAIPRPKPPGPERG